MRTVEQSKGLGGRLKHTCMFRRNYFSQGGVRLRDCLGQVRSWNTPPPLFLFSHAWILMATQTCTTARQLTKHGYEMSDWHYPNALWYLSRYSA